MGLLNTAHDAGTLVVPGGATCRAIRSGEACSVSGDSKLMYLCDMPSALDIRLLGEFRVTSSRPILFPTRKTGMLFAYLALHAGSAIPRDRFKSLLWSDRSEQQASGSLRRTLSDLRKLLDVDSETPVLDSTPTTVTLLDSFVTVDAVRFERLAAAATEQEWAEAAEIYQGDLLGEIPAPDPVFEDWLRIERERLRNLAVNFVERLAEKAVGRNVLDAAAELGSRLLRTDPACEEAHRALMICYQKGGRRNAAIKQYAACVEALQTALDVEPEQKTQELLKTVLTESGADGHLDVPEAAAPRPAPAAEAETVSAESSGSGPSAGDERDGVIILATDVAGFSRLVAADADAANAMFETYRDTILEMIAEHGGRVSAARADNIAAEFRHPQQAIRSAVAIQRSIRRRNADLESSRRQEFRVGLAFAQRPMSKDDNEERGKMLAEDLKEIAGPSGICMSSGLHAATEGEIGFDVTHLGARVLDRTATPRTVYRIDWRDHRGMPAHLPGRPPALPDKPSIAVLPFANLTEDREHEYFADALTEDVISALSRYRWFLVIARQSTFPYKQAAPDVERIARELGVRYLVRGSVRRGGDRIRVSGQLIESETGAALWAQHFDRDITDLFEIQDELTQNVAGAIEPEILIGESRRAVHQPTSNLDAYECCMRGMWHHHQMTPGNYTEALPWYRKAIALDPEFARAHMMLARTLWGRSACGFSDDILGDRSETLAAAERALALDSRDPDSHYVMFGSHLLAGRLEMALAEAQRALDLNPNYARAHLALGWVRVFLGHFDAAVEPLDTARRLSPHDVMDHFFSSRAALAHYHLDNFEEAARYAENAVVGRPTYFNLAVLLATLGRLGRFDEARELLPDIAAVQPAERGLYWDVMLPYADPAQRERLIDGLRVGGLEI